MRLSVIVVAERTVTAIVDRVLSGPLDVEIVAVDEGYGELSHDG